METTDFLIRDADSSDTDAVIALWHACHLTRPWNDPARDIARAQSQDSTRLVVGTAANQLVASAMVGYDGHRGWLYYLAVAPAHRRQGYGARLIAHAERYLSDLGCPKLMMMVRTGQPALDNYYAELGYTANDVHCLGKRLIPDIADGSG